MKLKAPMKLNTHTTISRRTSNISEGYICIEIIDKMSGCTIIETEIGLSDFAMAITGMGRTPSTSEFYFEAPIGKKHEIKTEKLSRLPVTNKFTEALTAKELLAPYEVDGWVGRKHDLRNPNRWCKLEDGSPGISVTFERWVDPDTENLNE